MCVCVCVCVCVCMWVYKYGIFTHLCPCFICQLEVQCPPGVTIGFVAEHWNLCRAVYSLKNEKKEDMMGVLGPCSTYGCGSDSVFEVNKYKHVSTIFFSQCTNRPQNNLALDDFCVCVNE